MSKCIYTQEQFDKILEERNKLANENFKLKQEFDIFTIKNAFKYQNVMEKSKMEFAVEYAIEQLEKLRTSIENADNNNDIYIRVNDFEVIDEIFYKQIEELKKEMK